MSLANPQIPTSDTYANRSNSGSRGRKNEPLGERELVSLIEQSVSTSIGHWGAGWGISGSNLGTPINRSSLADQRATALTYYERQPFGNEVEGESQVVSSDVFDTV